MCYHIIKATVYTESPTRIAHYPNITISSTDCYDRVTSQYDQLVTVLEALPPSVNRLLNG